MSMLVLTCFSVVLTCFLMAHKYTEDRHYSTKIMSRIAGVSAQELRTLEREFLAFVDYKLYVSEETYREYKESILMFHQVLVSSSTHTSEQEVTS